MSKTKRTETCDACGNEDDHIGFSEARLDYVCSDCVAFLAEHGHYPDEEGPERSVTVEYELEANL